MGVVDVGDEMPACGVVCVGFALGGAVLLVHEDGDADSEGSEEDGWERGVGRGKVGGGRGRGSERGEVCGGVRED